MKESTIVDTNLTDSQREMLHFAPTELFVEASPTLWGALRFQSVKPIEGKEEFFDKFDTLKNRGLAKRFEEHASAHGIAFHFIGKAQAEFDFLKDCATKEFTCDSPWLKTHELYPFQRFGMNFALTTDAILFCWDPGAGKTVGASLVAQRLIEDDRIDVCVVFCKRSKKVDWESFLKEATTLEVKRIEGTRKKRHEAYALRDAQVLVVNYEKARAPGKTKVPNRKTKVDDYSRTDLDELKDYLGGRRVLYVFDEAQAMGNQQSLLSKGVKKLIASNEDAGGTTRSIALTATPLVTSPYNIHAIFSVITPGLLGDKVMFESEYVSDWQQKRWSIEPVWNEEKLPVLGKRIEPHMHVAMKSDPTIAAQFPEMTEREVRVGLSKSDREIYRFIEDTAKKEYSYATHSRNESYLNLLRSVCCTSESLLFSSAELATHMARDDYWKLRTENSEKFEAISDLIATITEAGDKVVLFSFWRNLVIGPYMRLLTKRFKQVPLLTYIGGMRETDAARTVERFNSTDGPAVLFSSDAGAEGLNFYAPYLIHVEMPFTYATYKQRRERIHRLDSKERGIEHCFVYRFITTDSVEERIAKRVQQRKAHAEAIQGTSDVVTQEESLDSSEMYTLLFG